MGNFPGMVTDFIVTAEELSMVSVEEEVAWRTGSFVERAAEICSAQELPSWKTRSIARTLELNFNRMIQDGLSEEEALKRIDNQKLQFIAKKQ